MLHSLSLFRWAESAGRGGSLGDGAARTFTAFSFACSELPLLPTTAYDAADGICCLSTRWRPLTPSTCSLAPCVIWACIGGNDLLRNVLLPLAAVTLGSVGFQSLGQQILAQYSVAL